METSKFTVILSWILRLAVVVILFQTLFFKFAGAEESKYILSTLMGAEFEWVGRIGSGVIELIAVILILIPSTVWLGALLAFGTAVVAIPSHLFKLGIIVHNDGGLLFGLIVVVFLASIAILVIHRRQLPFVKAILSN